MKKILLVFGLIGFIGVMGVSAQAADSEGLYKRTCAGCHGADGSKAAGETDPIKGMSAEKLNQLLDGYKAGTQGGKHKNVMENVMKRLNDDDRATIVEYISTNLK